MASRADRHQWLSAATARALAEGLAQCGRFDEATATIAEAAARAELSEETFDLPDLLRARGWILMASSPRNYAAAEIFLQRALALANKQSALGWELRTAIPLARLWAETGRAADAATMLGGVYRRFTEGFDTANLKEAGRLLAELETRAAPR